ncbi:cell division protein FtsX [Stygiobacter electus]|uniref:Cell division protein FtsX n=1 Tax=Stygiobacter electus TaxID=3032292 RepID=A0AAE3TCM4_9BACT|nr:permease-like cell division protein FtsX [Stygiobacter electus]MDF1610607.1 permease-like cell division protein FtsX [Stygiobacter electus]
MIIFYFKEAFRIFRKSGYNSFLLIFITTLAILTTISSFLIVYGVFSLNNQIKSGIKINVFLSNEIEPFGIEKVKNEVKRLNGIYNVEFIDKEQAKKNFLKETGEDFQKVLDENPLPNSLKISIDPNKVNEDNIDLLVERIKKLNGVEEVTYDYQTILKIFRFLKILQFLFYPLSILLIVLSIYLVYSNNKLLIKQNQNLFNTMKLVGSKISAIRIPIVLNGFFIGLISSLLSVIILISVSILLTALLNNIRFTEKIIFLTIINFMIGIMLGVIGSYLSSREIQFNISKI